MWNINRYTDINDCIAVNSQVAVRKLAPEFFEEKQENVSDSSDDEEFTT